MLIPPASLLGIVLRPGSLNSNIWEPLASIVSMPTKIRKSILSQRKSFGSLPFSCAVQTWNDTYTGHVMESHSSLTVRTLDTSRWWSRCSRPERSQRRWWGDFMFCVSGGHVIGTKGQNPVPSFLSMPLRPVAQIFIIMMTSDTAGPECTVCVPLRLCPKQPFMQQPVCFGGIAVGGPLTQQPSQLSPKGRMEPFSHHVDEQVFTGSLPMR